MSQWPPQQGSQQPPNLGPGGMYAPGVPYPPRPSSMPLVAMILGICSIVMMGPVGFVLGLVSYNFAGKAMQDVARGLGDHNSMSYIKTAKICSTIGITIGSIFIVFMCVWFTCIGSAVLGGITSGFQRQQQRQQQSQPAPPSGTRSP
jgi:hypothetical protein